MPRVLSLLLPVVLLAACTAEDARIAAGAGVGAAIDRDQPVRGAILGAASGAIASELINRNAEGNCVYRDARTGQTFTAACPS